MSDEDNHQRSRGVSRRGLLAAGASAGAGGALLARTSGAQAASGTTALSPTAVQTAAYTASPGDFVPVDATGASVTVTLPTAPADQAQVGVAAIAISAPEVVTISCGGSDVLNAAGGPQTIRLESRDRSAILQYQASTKIWYLLADETSLNVPRGAAQLGTDGTVGGPGGSPVSAFDNVGQQAVASAYSGVTYRRGIVALRFDDAHGQDQTIIKPALDAALLPGGFAIVYGNLNNSRSGGVAPTSIPNLTTAQMLQMQADGHEIMCHTRNHTDPTLQADPEAFFLDECAQVGTDLRALGVFADSWVQPGTWTGAWNFTSYALTDGLVAQTWARNYGAAEAYFAEDRLYHAAAPLPSMFRFGGTHSTDGSDPAKTAAQLQGYVDYAVQYGGLVELLFHSFRFDLPGMTTSADFRTFIAYLQAQRDAGLLDVLTPTAARYAVQSDTVVNQLFDPSFEEEPSGAVFPVLPGSKSRGWHSLGGAPTVQGGVGRTGSNACIVAQGGPYGAVQQELHAPNLRSLRVDLWARSASNSGSVTAQMRMTGLQASSSTPIVDKTVTRSVGQTYQQLSMLVGTHPDIDVWRLTISVSGSGNAYIDDVSVVKI